MSATIKTSPHLFTIIKILIGAYGGLIAANQYNKISNIKLFKPQRKRLHRVRKINKFLFLN